jgi:hypothetical protein
MIAAFAPDFVATNDTLPAGPIFSDARARVEEIEQLYAAGYSTYDIATRLELRPRDVGRNLREVRKRHQRAARRQTEIMAVGQCAAIQREAMEGWRRSQEPKQAVTTRRKSGEADVVTTRTEDRGGNCSFLNTALRAMKQLRQFAGEAPAAARPASDAVRLALLEVLTPAQAAALKPQQVQQFRTALDRWKVILNAVENELHSADSSTEEQPLAQTPVETQSAPVPATAEPTPDAQSNPPEAQVAATADAGAADDAAKDAQSTLAARNGREPTSKKTPPQPRHPEWPAESFLSRSWLPPDHDFAVNRGENAVHPAETVHERNGCAP